MILAEWTLKADVDAEPTAALHCRILVGPTVRVFRRSLSLATGAFLLFAFVLLYVERRSKDRRTPGGGMHIPRILALLNDYNCSHPHSRCAIAMNPNRLVVEHGLGGFVTAGEVAPWFE